MLPRFLGAFKAFAFWEMAFLTKLQQGSKGPGQLLPATPFTYSLVVLTPQIVGRTHKAVGKWSHR